MTGYKVEPTFNMRGNGGAGQEPVAAARAYATSASTAASRPAPHHTQLPSIPSRIDKLESLSNKQLFELLTNKEKYQEFFESLEGPVNLKKVKV